MDFGKLVLTRESPKRKDLLLRTKSKEHVRESQNEVENFDDWLAAHMLLPFDEHMYLSTPGCGSTAIHSSSSCLRRLQMPQEICDNPNGQVHVCQLLECGAVAARQATLLVQ